MQQNLKVTLNPREPCQTPKYTLLEQREESPLQVRVGQDGLIYYWIRHSNFRDKDEASQVQGAGGGLRVTVESD